MPRSGSELELLHGPKQAPGGGEGKASRGETEVVLPRARECWTAHSSLLQLTSQAWPSPRRGASVIGTVTQIRTHLTARLTCPTAP